jgi:ABC-type bacteriocin/lantibiotic exporter with double-glycine peptidase domain
MRLNLEGSTWNLVTLKYAKNIILMYKNCTYKGHYLQDLEVSGWIQALSGQLDFPVVDGGKDLTRAQKQLLNLARIVLHQPPVVLLDEATNGLDAADEELISRIHFGHNLWIYNFKTDICEFLQVGF